MDAAYGAYVAAEKNTFMNTGKHSNINVNNSNNKANCNNKINDISNNIQVQLS